jgi:hypothetical protein
MITDENFVRAVFQSIHGQPPKLCVPFHFASNAADIAAANPIFNTNTVYFGTLQIFTYLNAVTDVVSIRVYSKGYNQGQTIDRIFGYYGATPSSVDQQLSETFPMIMFDNVFANAPGTSALTYLLFTGWKLTKG